MADKAVPVATDTRPAVPDTEVPLAAEGAAYNERLQELVSDTREALAKKTKRGYSDYTAVQFLKKNKYYWVKVSAQESQAALSGDTPFSLQVQIGGDQYVHLSIRRANGMSKLQGYQLDKTTSDPLESF